MDNTYLLNGISFFGDICLSKNPSFVNNDRIVIANELKDFCGICNKELDKYSNKCIFYSNNPLAIAVGLSIAENNLASRFNKFELNLIQHNTFCFVKSLSDGNCFEAMNLAVKMNLSNLVVIYEQADERLVNFFKKLGVNVAKTDADLKALLNISNAPILICIDDIKAKLSLDDFNNGSKKAMQSCLIGGTARERSFRSNMSRYKKKYFDEYKLFESFFNTTPKLNLDTKESISGLDLGNVALNKLANDNLNVIGGTPNLISETRAFVVGGGQYPNNPIGANINFAGFENVMYSVCAGISLHQGLFAYCADYLSRATRLLEIKQSFSGLFILFEDDIDNLSIFRMQQHFYVFRPCNASEVAFAYEFAFSSDIPTIVVLTKDLLCASISAKQDIANGGYVIYQPKSINGVILASGKDICTAFQVKDILNTNSVDVAIVSIPCNKLFEENALSLLKKFKRIKSIVALDSASNSYFDKYLPRTGKTIKITEASLKELAKEVYNIIKHNGERSESLFE